MSDSSTFKGIYIKAKWVSTERYRHLPVRRRDKYNVTISKGTTTILFPYWGSIEDYDNNMYVDPLKALYSYVEAAMRYVGVSSFEEYTEEYGNDEEGFLHTSSSSSELKRQYKECKKACENLCSMGFNDVDLALLDNDLAKAISRRVYIIEL